MMDWHPYRVPFPIAFTVLALAALVIAWIKDDERFRFTGLVAAMAAAVGAVLAYISGQNAHDIVHERFAFVPHEAVTAHERWALATSITLLAGAVAFGICQ